MTSGPSDGGAPPDPPESPGGWGQPPGEPARTWEPSPDAGRRHPLAVIGGLLVGLFLGFVGLPYASLVLVSSIDAAGDSGVLGFLGFGSPILIGIALLVPKQLRHVGAGILMGLAIGMIVGSAACLGLIGLFVASYNAGA